MASAALWPPVQPELPESAETLSGSPGTLLAVVPVNGGTSRLAIVGYLLPLPPPEGGPPPAGPAAGGLLVDAAQRRVLVSGRDAGLAFQEFELLVFLTANPGRAFTRMELLARAWGDHHQEITRTVDIHIHRLRRKLGAEYARRLVTVRRVGYMYQSPSAAS